MLAVFDTETTGVDTETARIVSAFVGLLDADGNPVDGEELALLVNPGIPIPEGATAIHGISTEHAAEHGTEPAYALGLIVGALMRYLEQGIPVVAFNAAYDLTLLDRETRRHTDFTLPQDRFAPIYDPYIVDKHISRRRGKRTLTATADHYGIRQPEGSPHGARYDAILSGRLMQHLLAMEGINGWKLSDLDPDRIHARTIEHAREQRQSLADYYRSAGRAADAAAVKTEWPFYPLTESSAK